MNRFPIVMAFVVGMWLAPAAQTAQAAPCLIVTLTGTQSGPPVFNGQAGGRDASELRRRRQQL